MKQEQYVCHKTTVNFARALCEWEITRFWCEGGEAFEARAAEVGAIYPTQLSCVLVIILQKLEDSDNRYSINTIS